MFARRSGVAIAPQGPEVGRLPVVTVVEDDLGLLPRAVIDLHLDLADAAAVAERVAEEILRSGFELSTTRRAEARRELHLATGVVCGSRERGVVAVLIDERDRVDPLRLLVPVETWREQSEGKAVVDRKRREVG